VSRPLRLIALLAALPGCIVFRDQAGVEVPLERVQEIRPGVTRRAQVLDALGPPTGRYSTELLATITRIGEPFDAPAAPDLLEDDVFTYQHVDIAARVVFVPLLFAWGESAITSKTLTVFFAPDGTVETWAWREDRP